MTLFQSYTRQIPTLDSLITFGAKFTAKKPGKRPTTTNPWTYDGIFLRYENTMHYIRYWDIHTGTVKTATHDSKDKIQYGDIPSNQSPASKHLMEVFTGSSKHTTNTKPAPVELKLKDENSITPEEIAKSVLDSSPLPYNQAAAATVQEKINSSTFANQVANQNSSRLENQPTNQNSGANENILIDEKAVDSGKNESSKIILDNNQLIDEITVSNQSAPNFINEANEVLFIKEDEENKDDDNTFDDPATTVKSILTSDTSLNHRQKRRIRQSVNKFLSKAPYTRPDVSQLKHELETIDISTNTFINTISETISIQEKIKHPTLGMVTRDHPDIKDATELIEFQPGTSTHRHI